MSQELKIEDTRPGDGKAVVKGALITTHYTGWLGDGTVFDSSHQRGKPFQCVIGTGRVIKGWEQLFSHVTLGPCYHFHPVITGLSMKQAISYVRFSSDRQKHGGSVERQEGRTNHHNHKALIMSVQTIVHALRPQQQGTQLWRQLQTSIPS